LLLLSSTIVDDDDDDGVDPALVLVDEFFNAAILSAIDDDFGVDVQSNR
jgi:hypothetical protein